MKSPIKLNPAARFLKPYKKLLNYYNFVEFILPALIFLLLIYGNYIFVLEQKIIIELNSSLISIFANLIVPAFLLLTIGWLMYASRFYQLFPGYKSKKQEFRKKLGGLFEKQVKIKTNQKELLGKYLFKKFWEISTKLEKENQLKLHVNWVFLVHLCNSIMLSFFLCFFLYTYKSLNTGFTFDKLMITWSAFHILFYFYFRRGALKNMVKSNFEIIDIANKRRAKFLKHIPPNISEILDAMY